MTNKAKNTGTEWESRCAGYLNENATFLPPGFEVERRAQQGAKDRGDLIIPGWMSECKGGKGITLSSFCNERDAQVKNCKPGTLGFVWIKRSGYPIARSYIVLDPPTMLELMADHAYVHSEDVL